MIESIDNFPAEAVVVDAGTFPTSPHALSWLERCNKVVCCDGAANDYIASGRVPWRIVGDCDSLLPELTKRYADRVVRMPDQETNDQTKAVLYLTSQGIVNVVIIGATGKREDHTIGNVSLLIDYLRQGINSRIYTDHGVFIPVRNQIQMKCRPSVEVSIFNFGATDLQANGLQYPLRDFTSWWQGTLNVTTGTEFRITARGYFLVFVNY